jgi:hypothetical protein
LWKYVTSRGHHYVQRLLWDEWLENGILISNLIVGCSDWFQCIVIISWEFNLGCSSHKIKVNVEANHVITPLPKVVQCISLCSLLIGMIISIKDETGFKTRLSQSQLKILIVWTSMKVLSSHEVCSIIVV